MKHTGSCTKKCGHALDFGHVLANPQTQHALDTDPRVVEWSLIEDGHVCEFIYATSRVVNAIHYATAAQLGIRELSGRGDLS
jgi:hypothetical protein